jgi:vacuolar iron transporter family protein
MKQNIRLYFPDVVFGAIDGIVTTFAIIAGVYGASLSASLILILGFANVFADGFSMGVSNYLASDSQTVDIQVDRSPVASGFVTFFSFIFIGTIPLLPFLYFSIQNQPVTDVVFLISFCASLVAFFVFGILKGIVTNTSLWKSGLITFFIGSTASLIAFIVGRLLSSLA